MHDNYTLRVRENILPLSLANDLPEAFKEWYFSDKIKYHAPLKADCELCNQENLRYHFEIKNDSTENKLWVGSSCILKFELAVYDDYGALLNKKKANQKLKNLIRKMQCDSCINSLEILAQKEKHKILIYALEYYKRKKKLTPNLAAFVCWKMKQNKINYQVSFFKIDLSKDKYKDDLEDLEPYKVHAFWPALTPQQKKIAQERGHLPPNQL